MAQDDACAGLSQPEAYSDFPSLLDTKVNPKVQRKSLILNVLISIDKQWIKARSVGIVYLQHMNLRLEILDAEFAIFQLSPDSAIPSWLNLSPHPLLSITRTDDELSVICPASVLPPDVPCEPGWRAFKVVGKLEFSAVGILASILTPLAEASIGILAISTFDTDYILVRSHALELAKLALRRHFQLEP